MKVCIDPGHNSYGADTGAEGNGLREQDLTLNICRRIKPLLESNGISVVLTRDGDLVNGLSTGYTLIQSLQRRVDIAENFKADLFVSVHINAGGGTGEEILIQGSGGRAETLANKILPYLVQAGSWYNRGVKVQDVMVLRETSMPAILTENGFIDSGGDSSRFKYTSFFHDLAVAHAKGICAYFGIQYKEGVVKVAETTTDKDIYLSVRVLQSKSDAVIKQIVAMGYACKVLPLA